MSTRIRSQGFCRGGITLVVLMTASASADDSPPQPSAVDAAGSAVNRDNPAEAGSPKVDVVKATDSATKRDSQPTVDPWMASSSTALFSRPTVGESFKFSSEANSEGSVLSVGFSPGALWAPGTPALTSLQLAGAYSINDGIGSFSLKWAAPFRDVRTFSPADMQRLTDASVKALEACDAAERKKAEEEEKKKTAQEKEEDEKKTAQEKEEERNRKDEKRHALCLEKRTATEDAEVARIRPGLSMGASMGYGFRSQRLERLAANVAYDQKLWGGTSLIINADMESQVRELPQEDGGLRVERAWQAGGSVGLAWRPGAAFLKQRLEVSAGAKLLQCLQGCAENPSSVKFGPQASFALDKDTVLGASVNWTGEASSLRDALVGVAVSHSFGLLNNDTQ
ncbi:MULTISPECIES: hypothetical protein [unclassified Corallococcus]|uniref:hypothetical protein n=1 Tax=unclassified Corallococcus TaxID=2685029 RepID=UPI001A907FF3|nr:MULTISPECIES: hypothetical protein [unclassified Corallococcus]MBN9685726.1 hypothetical protein [Corallococcus sp. NCSPR001]WAS82829.1 hypothetical protein O0N60_26315 [Corallococcus sp. NCRR]